MLDITNPDPTKATFVNVEYPLLDASSALGDSVSRVYIPLGSSDVSKGATDSLGLVTEFRTGGPDPLPKPGLPQVVPEPGALVVFLLAFAGLLARRNRTLGPGR